MMIWAPEKNFIISDLHLGHNNLRRYESQYRSDAACGGIPFEDFIAQRWDEVVPKDAVVWVLGDVVWRVTGFENWLHDRPGTKFLVRGNHDSNRTNAWFKRWGFSSVIPLWTCADIMDRKVWIEEGVVQKRGRLLMSHYPVAGGGNRYVERIRECREAFWSHACTLNVHGHTHSHNVDDPRCFNASCENIGLTPVSMEDILCRTSTFGD